MKFDFTKQPTLPTSLKGSHDVIISLWGICAEIDELKEKLNTNSKNSSMPPSKDLKKSMDKSNGKRRGNKKKRKQGGQPGHPKHKRELVPESEVDHVEKLPPKKQCECQGLIIPSGNYLRQQQFELPPITPVVTEYQRQEGSCCNCGKRHFGKLPNKAANFILGPRAIAMVATLTGSYRTSKRNVVALFHDIYRFKISTGTICKAEKIASAALKYPVEEAKKFIKNKKTEVHADETGHKEKGKRMWAWVAVACYLSIFIIRPSRGSIAAKELLGEDFSGTLITDRWSAYSWVSESLRQLCWSHLLRDFEKISERNGTSKKIGMKLIRLTEQMFRYWRKVKHNEKTKAQFQKYMTKKIPEFEKLLRNGTRCKNKKTKGMCKEILKLKNALWTFVRKEGVEPTNNLAERTIRTHVIWTKTSFGTQSKVGTLYMERVLTVVGSCKLQQRNVLEFMTSAVNGYYENNRYPSLIPMNSDDIESRKAA